MLKLNGLNKSYSDGTHALKGVSISLGTGMVGLLGPNGAGKSTLMRTLATIQAPDSGSYTFQGINPLERPQELRSLLGYLPQYFGVYPHLSCEQLLKHIAVLKGIELDSHLQSQIEDLLVMTNLTKYRDKSVTKFSGGMRQRFGIAQALLGDPKLIILDEPTAGLDPHERDRLHENLIELSKDRLILFSTHIVSDIEDLCPHVALMTSGEIKRFGDVQSVLSDYDQLVWESKKKPEVHSSIIGTSYTFGEPKFRILSQSQPGVEAVSVSPSLQDIYSIIVKDMEVQHAS